LSLCHGCRGTSSPSATGILAKGLSFLSIPFHFFFLFAFLKKEEEGKKKRSSNALKILLWKCTIEMLFLIYTNVPQSQS